MISVWAYYQQIVKLTRYVTKFRATTNLIELAHLSNLKQTASGSAWLSQLPASIDRVCIDWQLEPNGKPYLDSTVSYVLPVTQNGEPAVLKFQWPHEECLYEADALKRWNGVGAVKLLATNREGHVLLLEQCYPGQSLANAEIADKLGVVIDILPRLWVSASAPFKTLTDEARGWQSRLDTNWKAFGKPMNRLVVQTVSDYIDELADTQVNQVLVHQDLHAGNILSAQRMPWLAIDPKPLIGEREFSVASVVRCAELGHSRCSVADRLDRLCAALQLDRDRARKWTVVQTFCWALCEGSSQSMFDVVGWLIEGES